MRQLTMQDRDEAVALDHFAFVGDPSAQTPEEALDGVDLTRTFVAEHDEAPGRVAGLCSSYDLRLRVPGTRGTTRAVPVDGLTWVGVHPDLRRRGVLTTMMTDFLARARDRGEIIAGLHASEPGIYGRFGFSVASHDVSYELGRETSFDAPAAVTALADATATELLWDLDDDGVAARLHAIDAAQPTPGTVLVPEAVIRRRLRDKPTTRVGKEPLRAVVARRDGRDVGCAVFRRSVEWTDGSPDGTLAVHHLAAVDAGAMLALGRRLVDMDLMSRTRFPERGLDDPLLAWAGAVRTRSVRICDALWLRPVEVGGMLAARGYAAELDIALDVTDRTCEWNTGVWRLRADAAGEATCERTDARADATLDVDVLGEMYLGLVGPRALADRGRIVEATPGTVDALTRAFATGVHPIGGTGF